MVELTELRPGNYIMQKIDTRIVKKKCSSEHFALGDGGKSLFPLVLTAELFTRCGFTENKDFPLLPAAREFILLLPGSSETEIRGYVKSNNECFARAMLNRISISVPVHHLHRLQNLYHALTGKELEVQI